MGACGAGQTSHGHVSQSGWRRHPGAGCGKAPSHAVRQDRQPHHAAATAGPACQICHQTGSRACPEGGAAKARGRPLRRGPAPGVCAPALGPKWGPLQSRRPSAIGYIEWHQGCTQWLLCRRQGAAGVHQEKALVVHPYPLLRCSKCCWPTLRRAGLHRGPGCLGLEPLWGKGRPAVTVLVQGCESRHQAAVMLWS